MSTPISLGLGGGESPPNPPSGGDGGPPKNEEFDSEKFVNEWMDRIKAGDASKEEWEKDYSIELCKQFWRGNQLEEPYDEFDQLKVQINKIHPSVKASLPTLYFHDVFARVHASPALADTPGQRPGLSLDEKAQLLQDFANTLIWDEDTNFDEATHLSTKEAHWSIGAVEVRYDAVSVENPAVEAPPIQEKEETQVPPVEPRFGEVLGLGAMRDVSMLIKEERFYVKRIPARQMICSADQSGVIRENNFIGYWSINYLQDVKNTHIYENTEDLKASATLKEDNKKSPGDQPFNSQKVKLFHIWSLRDKTKLVFAEGHKKPLYNKKYKRLNLFPLRFDVDPDFFWPIPPIYHQLHPQIEFNDSREWLRKNRKGTVPRYTYDRNALDPKDMKKLEAGEMGTYIPREEGTHNAIEPVPQPNYSVVAQTTLALAKEEFVELSMVAGESRGVAQSDTATQAKIIDVRSQVQESFDRVIVGKWLSAIVKEMILLAIDRMSVRKMILKNADQFAGGFQLEAQRIEQMWQEITHEDLTEAANSLKWRVEIEPASMSPVAEQEESERWDRALSLLGSPIMSRLLAVSPALRKKTLDLKGIKSARDQELIGEALMIMVQMEREMAMMGGPAPPGVASQPGAGPGPKTRPPQPPSPEEMSKGAESSRRPVMEKPSGPAGIVRMPS